MDSAEHNEEQKGRDEQQAEGFASSEHGGNVTMKRGVPSSSVRSLADMIAARNQHLT
jgi:hypothetical protein